MTAAIRWPKMPTNENPIIETSESAYHPFAQQKRFHQLCKKFRFGLFLGGVGSGKTVTGVHEIFWAALDNPGVDGVIGAPTYPMLRDVVLPTWERWISPRLYRYNRSDQCFVLWSGQRIFLRTATFPDRARGLNLGYAWIDESEMIRKRAFWDILKSRIRDPNAKHPRVIVTTTPAGKTYLIKEFMENADGQHFIIRTRTSDNKFLPDDFEAGLRATYGDEFARQELDAAILEMQGMAWPIYPRLHLFDNLESVKTKLRAYFGGIDWGYTNQAALIVGGYDGENWALVDSWYKRGQTRETVAAAASDLQAKWGVKCWFSDHDPEGVLHLRKKQIQVELAEKDVVAGVQHVRSLLPVRHNRQPRLIVARYLKDWLNEQEGYTYPEGSEEPEGQNGDHLMDATRYMIYTHAKKYQPFLMLKSGNTTRIDKQARALT